VARDAAEPLSSFSNSQPRPVGIRPARPASTPEAAAPLSRLSSRGQLAIVTGAARPRQEAALTAQGHPRTIFQRAIEHGNLLLAEATAREMGRLSLVEALDLTVLIAQKARHRHQRAGARWLLRDLEADEDATITDVSLAAACLGSLGGRHHGEAVMEEA
jgi:hypothetical protein